MCAFRFFDSRLLHGCAVVDYLCVKHQAGQERQAKQVPQERREEANTAGRMLRQCVAQPITMTDMSRRLAELRSNAPARVRAWLEAASAVRGQLCRS